MVANLLRPRRIFEQIAHLIRVIFQIVDLPRLGTVLIALNRLLESLAPEAALGSVVKGHARSQLGEKFEHHPLAV